MEEEIKKGLELIGDFIVLQLRTTLGFTEQNHNATGALSASIKRRVSIKGDSFGVEIWALDYAEKIDKGQPVKTRVSSDVILKWMQIRGIENGNPNQKNIAFLIARAIYREGTPTSGSLKYSRSKKKTEFIKVTIDQNAKEIFNMILKVFVENISGTLKNTVRNQQKNFSL